eukprot:COSAG02_NODE_244_length_27402_cov_41.050397_3_plen_301_part_00
MPRNKRNKRPSTAASAAPQPEPEVPPENCWICVECEQENDPTEMDCIACDIPRIPIRSVADQIDCEAYSFQRVFSPAICAQLIGMSHERTFSLDLEHVDDKPVYQIDLVQNGWVADDGMWSVIGPLFDRQLRPLLGGLPWLKGTAFTLHFAFLKRYRPEERTHLGIHLDSSFFTFNVLLSDPDDFDGGEIYIFTPQQTAKHFGRHETMTTEQKDAWVRSNDALPIVRGYCRGDVLAFTGDRHLHGTLPTTRGERVVLTFFFEHLTDESMGRHCSECHEWCEVSRASPLLYSCTIENQMTE